MCGEMAGEVHFALLLLGMGLDEFSMPSYNIPLIKQIIRSVSTREACECAQKAMGLATVKEVEEFIQNKFKALTKDFLG
jgi:phosphotransferase system enzyme I (PtsI)